MCGAFTECLALINYCLRHAASLLMFLRMRCVPPPGAQRPCRGQAGRPRGRARSGARPRPQSQDHGSRCTPPSGPPARRTRREHTSDTTGVAVRRVHASGSCRWTPPATVADGAGQAVARFCGDASSPLGLVEAVAVRCRSALVRARFGTPPVRTPSARGACTNWAALGHGGGLAEASVCCAFLATTHAPRGGGSSLYPL